MQQPSGNGKEPSRTNAGDRTSVCHNRRAAFDKNAASPDKKANESAVSKKLFTFTPYFYEIPRLKRVFRGRLLNLKAMSFNLLKGIGISIVTMLLYKRLTPILKGRQE